MTVTLPTDAPAEAAEAAEASRIRAAVATLRAGGPEAVLAAARSVLPDLAERAADYDRRGVFPRASIDRVFEVGLGGLSIPAERGGAGASLATTARAVELLAGADASVAFILIWQLGQLRMVDARWPSAWRDRITAEALAGPALINSLRVEPELGTPARGGVPATTARRVTAPDGSPAWQLNGRKIYSTGSTGLRWLSVWAATATDDPDGLQVGSFLVPGGSAGVEIVEGSWDHLGMRATASHEVVFRDVVIPLDHAVGLVPFTGVDPAMAGPAGSEAAWIPLLEAALYTGVARAARDWLARYLNERTPTNLGAPLASLPRFQSAVGEIELLLYANDRLIGDLTARVDRWADGGVAIDRSETAWVKVLASRNVIAATELAVSLVGNPGLSVHNPLQRHYRDALCSRVHTPQPDVVLASAGAAALATYASAAPRA